MSPTRTTLLAMAIVGGAGCYSAPTSRPGSVSLGPPTRTIETPWGRERIAELERRGDEIFVVAAERPHCRPFSAGSLRLVDIETQYLEDDGRPLRPWDLIFTLVGGGIALGFAILPAALGDPYEDGHYAAIGLGSAMFGILGLVTIIPAAMPDQTSEEIVTQKSGGHWAGGPSPCGPAAPVGGQITLRASRGSQSVGWRFPVESGERVAIPRDVSNSVRFWADACQVPIDIELQLSDERIPSKVDQIRLGSRSDPISRYPGANGYESGPDAGAGHDRLFGTNVARMRWNPGAKIKKAPSNTPISQTPRKLGEACIQKVQGDFLKVCKKAARDRYQDECATKCKKDGNAIDCNWGREDCKTLGGSDSECSLVFDRCMREKGLDASGLQRCTDSCLDRHAAVKAGNQKCDDDWLKR